MKRFFGDKIFITFDADFNVWLIAGKIRNFRGVAQLVSAPRSGRGGRKFESSHPDKTEKGPVAEAIGPLFFRSFDRLSVKA